MHNHEKCNILNYICYIILFYSSVHLKFKPQVQGFGKVSTGVVLYTAYECDPLTFNFDFIWNNISKNKCFSCENLTNLG